MKQLVWDIWDICILTFIHNPLFRVSSSHSSFSSQSSFLIFLLALLVFFRIYFFTLIICTLIVFFIIYFCHSSSSHSYFSSQSSFRVSSLRSSFSSQSSFLFFLLALGPSIKYVTLFLANFDPPPPVTLCHTSRNPQKSASHISDPPPFLVGLIKNSDKNPLS